MSNLEMLRNANDPLNIESLRRLIELFSYNQNFHMSMMSANKRNNSRVNLFDKKQLDDEMFISWKKDILALSKEDIIDLYQEAKIDKDFLQIRNFLVNNKDVFDHSSFIGLINKNGLSKTYDVYRWDSNRNNGGWTYINSNKFYSHKEEPFKTKHNLYINTNSDDTYKMASIFRKKCEEESLPYLFKISESPFRDDSIVIYASDEVLDKYLNILESIKKENPDLISRINNPPILTAKVDYYGYGSEPSKKEDGRIRSYNIVRSNIVENIIADKGREWFYKNRYLTLNDYTIMDAIVKECTDRMFLNMKKNYSNALEYEKEYSKKYHINFNEDFVYRRMGYNLDKLQDYDFKDKIIKTVRMNMERIIADEKLLYRHPLKPAISIPLENGKIYNVNYGDISRIIKRSVVGITKFDPNFINSVMTTIRNKYYQENIEEKNFAFSRDFDIEKIKSSSEKKSIRVYIGPIDWPEFEDLKDLAANYKIEFDKESNKLKVYNIKLKDKKEEDDVVVAQDALFANIWLNSVATSKEEGEIRPGINSAFGKEGELLYKFFVKGSEHSINKTGNLNSLFLYKNASKLKLEDAGKLIVNLFNNDYQTIFIDNYVHGRTKSSKPRTKGAEPLYTLENAEKLLEEKLNKDSNKGSKK